MTNIIQLTDTHIVLPGQKAYGVVDTTAALETAVATIARLPELIGHIDAVVVTGDLTDFGDPGEYARFREITSALDIPFAVVPGNHDRRDAMRQAFGDLPTMPPSGPINWTLSFDDMTVIGLDTLVEGSAHGELSDETLAWLEDTLAEIGANPLLVAMHHHPFASKIGHMDKQGLRNARHLFNLLKRCYGPVTVACGHVHRMISTTRQGIPVFISPSPAHAVALDHRPNGPSNLMREPGGLLLHSTQPADLSGDPAPLVSELIPSGTFDGPYPFFPD